MSKIVKNKLIKRYHDDLLAGHFGIDKTLKFITKKYDWPTFYTNVQAYVTNYGVYLASKAIRYKSYNDFQLLSIPTD